MNCCQEFDFEFLHPLSKATEKTKTNHVCFAADLYRTENKKFLYNAQQCLLLPSGQNSNVDNIFPDLDTKSIYCSLNL
jgi:hypothetical protein